MPSIKQQLSKMAAGDRRTIGEIEVECVDDGYLINGEQMLLAAAVERLSTDDDEYGGLAFIVIQPYSAVPQSVHRIVDTVAYNKLLKHAREHGLHVYRASTRYTEDSRTYAAHKPWIFEWGCLKADATTVTQETTSSALRCLYCGKSFKSGSGLTLHVQQKHPESLAEYMKSRV